tara:strand:- start:7047 stop:7823 length:777 start_codon:yes stop_codon:yes gene_type:complete
MHSRDLNIKGFMVVRGLLKKQQLAGINKSISEVLLKPSAYRIKNVKEDGSLFFMDYNNWRKNNYIEKVCKDKNIIKVVKTVTGSKNCWLMHEDIIVKRGPSGDATPPHHDRPYFIFKGELNVSVWISISKVTEETSMRCYEGSHKIDKLFRPKFFRNHANIHGTDHIYSDISEFDFEKYPCSGFELEPGDAIIFHHKTVHDSLPHIDISERRSLVIRYLLDSSTLTKVYCNNVPPYERLGVNIVEDGPIPENFFPKVG